MRKLFLGPISMLKAAETHSRRKSRVLALASGMSLPSFIGGANEVTRDGCKYGSIYVRVGECFEIKRESRQEIYRYSSSG